MKTALLVCFIAGTAAAQQMVTIEGTVADPAGRPVGGLWVSVADLASADGATGSAQTSSDGSFRISVSPGVYSLATAFPPQPLTRSLLRVDARRGNVSGIQIRLSAQTPLVPDEPPRAALISVSPPDANAEATVTGAVGAVAPGAFLIIVTIDTGDTVTARAADDGSFRVRTFAPAGASILVKSDPYGLAFRTLDIERLRGGMHLSLLAGTIVRSADPPAGLTGVPFSRTGLAGLSGPVWTFEGTISNAAIQPGNTVRIDGTLRLVYSALPQTGRMRVAITTYLDKVAAANGDGSLAQNTFVSTLMTPTGFPIERERNIYTPYSQSFDLVRTASDRAEGAVRITLTLPPDQPHGLYVPVASIFFENVPPQTTPDRFRIGIEGNKRRAVNDTYLPVIRVGDPQPPRVPAMLLADTISNGTRGVRAVEDRNRFGLSSRIRFAETFVIPRLDLANEPLSYRLEPFLPTVALMMAGRPNLPLIPFRFPSGELTVRIQAPDGSIRRIGPAPFLQARLRSSGLSETSLRDFYGGHFAGTVITECYQLSTLDPRFNVQFERDGKHVITIEGMVEDLWGNRWLVGGTYEVHVARILSVGTAVMAGTPFEVGDVFDPALVLDPAVAADVEVRVHLAPQSDPSRMMEREIRGRANRFGIFTPVGSRVAFDEPGEYRVDVTATFIDEQGAAWVGTRTWGNVVAPRDTPIIAHGRRGMVNTQVLGTPWFFRTQTPFPTLPHTSHPNPPFFSGDVFWAQEADTAFVMFTFQDPSRLVTDILQTRQRESSVPLRDPGTFADREPLGELPLFSSRADRMDPHVDPSRVDLWGYSYRFVERPMIAVRELIAEDNTQSVYWDFDEPYAGQIGIGDRGDLPNDLKFYFGGVVLRGSAIPRPLYAIYNSLFILVDDGDSRGGSRIFPPFQGNPGGQNGGPLFTLKGRDIDMFFHPTVVRPGSVFQRNEIVSFSGYSAPPLPSKIEAVITSPSGQTRTIRGQANKIGYFHGAAQTLRLEEEGVWRARVKIVFDGATSAGQVLTPYPTGDVLGSRTGEFHFYVVRGDAPPLQLGPMPRFVRPADGPITFTIHRPPGLTNVEMTYTTTMPGFILEEGTTSALTYTYDANKLARDFPNLDLNRTSSASGGDTITISFLLTGLDTSGVRKHFARQIVIQGEELQMPEQKPAAPTRRRSAR